MDRFLGTIELRSIVCDNLRGDKESLLALALSNHARFFDPAMDTLWRTVDSFDPLLSCLPEDVWREEEIHHIFSSKRYLVLPIEGRPITRDDLARFEVYAKRIKIFGIQRKQPMRILSVEFLESLRAATAGQFGSLAPQLLSFTWTSDGQKTRRDPLLYEKQFKPALSLFVGDKLMSLSLHDERGWPDSFVEAFTARLPSLERLSLRFTDLDLAFRYLVSAPWTNLRSLTLRRISDDIIRHLATLPRLAYLKVKFLTALTGQHARVVSGTADSFSHLEDLVISCDCLETAVMFLQHLPNSTGLRTLKCSTRIPSSPPVSQEIIGLAAGRLNRRTLEVLELRDNDVLDTGGEPVDAEPISDHDRAVIDMSPLVVFPNLTTLILAFEGTVRVTPTEVLMITSTWPRMECLDLCGTYPITRPLSLDHTHLFQVAEGCPRLHTLGLPFDATGVTGTERSAHGPFMRLEALHVAGSSVEYPACVAAFFLRGNFPNAKPDPNYNTFVLPTEPHWRRWIEVGRALSLRDPPW